MWYYKLISHHALSSAQSRCSSRHQQRETLDSFSLSPPQTIKTRRSPHGSISIQSPALRAMSEAWEELWKRPGRIWIHGRRAATRDVAARMPANCVSRFLLFVSICAVREALAKSLPDQGAFGKLATRGDAAQWEDGEWLHFYGFLSTSSAPRSSDIMSAWRRWISGGGFLVVSAL